MTHSLQVILAVTIVALSATMIGAQHKHLFRFKNKEGKVGYIDVTGTWVIPPSYNDGFAFSEGLAGVVVGQKCGVIDTLGNFIISPRFTARGLTLLFREGLAAVPGNKPGAKEGGWGFIDANGDWVIDPEYENVKPFSNGMAVVSKRTGRQEWHYTYIDKNGKKMNDYFFTTANDFRDGYGLVGFDKRDGYIDDDGTFVFETDKDIRETYVRGFVDQNGVFLGKRYFYRARSFSAGRAAVAVGYERWGYIDTAGAWLVSPKYKSASSFTGGYAGGTARVTEGINLHVIRLYVKGPNVKEDRLWTFRGGFPPENDVVENLIRWQGGFWRPTGGWQIRPGLVLGGQDFSEGLAAAYPRNGKKWGFIDKSGSWKISPIFDEAKPFNNGLAEVRLGTGAVAWGYVDNEGKVLPLEFENYVKKKQQRLSR